MAVISGLVLSWKLMRNCYMALVEVSWPLVKPCGTHVDVRAIATLFLHAEDALTKASVEGLKSDSIDEAAALLSWS